MKGTTRHWNEERRNRNDLIENVIGIGNPIKETIIDRGHRNGAERHVLTDTGIIVIYNVRTDELITKLIARVGQVKRYYEDGKAPKEVVRLARKHTELGYNYY